MTAPDKPGLSNEAFIEKWRKYLQGDREDTGEQIIYNLRVLPEALDRLEALIGQRQEERKDLRAVAKEARIMELEAELEARKKAWEEMDALCYAALDGAICETVQDGQWLKARKADYARLHAELVATLPKGGA